MRLKALLLVAAIGVTALPATAQSYRDPCRDQRGDNQAAGLILGGILGGVLGSNIAASGHRHDGTALGAVLGGVVGSEIGRGSVDCNRSYYGRGQSYPPPPHDYGYSGYPSYPSPYRSPRGYSPAPDYGYYPQPEYRDRDYRYDDYGYEGHSRDSTPHKKYSGDVYAYGSRDYIGDDYAGRDCSDAVQITRLPDGSEIRRTVDACRNAYYGGWKVED